MTDLTHAIREYAGYLEHEKGSAKTTIKCFINRLNAFARWMQTNGYPTPKTDDLSVAVCRKYLYFLSKKGDRPRTVRGCFDALRSFCAYQVSTGVLVENVAAGVKPPKLDAAQRLLVTDADVAALFEACERQRSQRQVALSRAVLSLLCYAALRRMELCDLLVSDVDLIDKAILVRSGKGNKSRKVFINKQGIEALREWLAVREKHTKHDYLFSVDPNRRLHFVGLSHLLQTLAATAGMRGNQACKPHSLRHWALTNLLRNGANIKDVQTFAGHSDIQTTSRYLHSSEEQLRGIAELTALKPQPDSPHCQAKPLIVRNGDILGRDQQPEPPKHSDNRKPESEQHTEQPQRLRRYLVGTRKSPALPPERRS